jgi:hypothetical protein
MTIEQINNELIFRIPLDIGYENLENIIRYLKYLETVKESRASEKDANLIADESKKRWWAENKHKYIKRMSS